MRTYLFFVALDELKCHFGNAKRRDPLLEAKSGKNSERLIAANKKAVNALWANSSDHN